MEAEQIKAMLEKSGLPVAYRYYRRPPPLPYLVWLEDSTDNFYADGLVYKKVRHIRVELYTDQKDPAAETRLENALAGLPWQKTWEEWIESEDFFQSIYEFEV